VAAIFHRGAAAMARAIRSMNAPSSGWAMGPSAHHLCAPAEALGLEAGASAERFVVRSGRKLDQLMAVFSANSRRRRC